MVLGRLIAVLILLAFLPGGGLQAQSSPCAPAEPCRFGADGEYRVLPPPDWDGRRPIGAFLFVHGHRASAREMMNYRELAAAAHALGFLLVAPQGLGDSWSTKGSPGEGRRDEVAFLAGLLDDLGRRYPLDTRRIVASGFSQGGAVVWEFACRGDGRIRAFMPIAGVWWRPMPTECPAPRRPMLHIHGLADPVMPMEGRSLRDRWRQGDVREAFATMRRLNACEAAPVTAKRGELDCAFDESCGSGRSLALCLHPGDHHTNPAWFRDLRDWLEQALAQPD